MIKILNNNFVTVSLKYIIKKKAFNTTILYQYIQYQSCNITHIFQSIFSLIIFRGESIECKLHRSYIYLLSTFNFYSFTNTTQNDK